MRKGFIKNTLDWIKDYVQDDHLVHEYYKEIYPAHTVHVPFPNLLDYSPTWISNFGFSPSYVAVIPNGRVWGYEAHIIQTIS